HSFDNLYGHFPGANGVANATPEQTTQLDHDGTPLPELVVFGKGGEPDPHYPRLPNAPFLIDGPPVNRSLSDKVPSPTHLFYQNQQQINGGANNRFVAMSQVGGWVMGTYSGRGQRLWGWAREFTLADNFFMGAFGGSYLNHQYLICACAPRFDDAPASMRAQLDAQGHLALRPDSPSARVGAVRPVSANGGQVTPDGLSVNTTQPPYQPSGIPPAPGRPDWADPQGTPSQGLPLPPQTAATIGDRLSARGVSWAWYAGGWDAALADGEQPAGAKRHVIYAGGPGSPMFQPHHQPFNYYAAYAPGAAARAQHLKDGDAFRADIARGTLPAVAFYKPAGVYTQHPSYTTVDAGDAHIDNVLRELRASPQWPRMLVIVTYDENGGYWDHVPPPRGPGWSDRLGPGTRVPALLIGPLVRRNYIDHTAYDTGSILKLLTERFGLTPLPGVRTNVGDLSAALQ
ncbi:MAG: acid phosphatase, partial [Betaproteobacteria bacterium]|nr:acid phosphatase [Betaproteobacteria bacterium]